MVRPALPAAAVARSAVAGLADGKDFVDAALEVGEDVLRLPHRQERNGRGPREAS